jgi:protein TonB
LIGTAVVRFKVNAAGELIEREIATSSGKKVLDDAALASIEKSAPFPPMPKGLNETIELSVPFRFTVR